jgi:hypothetical protein
VPGYFAVNLSHPSGQLVGSDEEASHVGRDPERVAVRLVHSPSHEVTGTEIILSASSNKHPCMFARFPCA